MYAGVAEVVIVVVVAVAVAVAVVAFVIDIPLTAACLAVWLQLLYCWRMVCWRVSVVSLWRYH